MEGDCPASEKEKGDALNSRLTMMGSLYLATIDGLCCLGLSKNIGPFDRGMKWDTQLASLGAPFHLGYPCKRYERHEYEDSPESQISAKTKDEHINRKQGDQYEVHIQFLGIKTWEEKMTKWAFGGDNEIPSRFGFREIHLFSEGEIEFPIIAESEAINGS